MYGVEERYASGLYRRGGERGAPGSGASCSSALSGDPTGAPYAAARVTGAAARVTGADRSGSKGADSKATPQMNLN